MKHLAIVLVVLLTAVRAEAWPAGSEYVEYYIPTGYDYTVSGVVQPDQVTVNLSTNVLTLPTPWARFMPIAGPGIDPGNIIGTIAPNGLSLTLAAGPQTTGAGVGHKLGVSMPLTVLVTPPLTWRLPAADDASSEWLILVQSPGAGGGIGQGPGGAGACERMTIKNLQPGATIVFSPGVPGAGSATLTGYATDATMTQVTVYDSLTPSGELINSPSGGHAAVNGTGRGGDNGLPANPSASPHIINSAYYPFDGGDSGRLDAVGFGTGGVATCGGGPLNVPTGGQGTGSGGGVAGPSWPTGAYGMPGAFGVAFIQRVH